MLNQTLKDAIIKTGNHFDQLLEQGFFGEETADSIENFLDLVEADDTLGEVIDTCSGFLADDPDAANEVLEYLFAQLSISSVDQLKQFA